MSRRLIIALVPVALVVAACGGGSDDGSASDLAGDPGSDVVVDGVSAAATSADLTEVATAIEAAGYDCTPDSFVMTSAIRETCLTTSSISLIGYAWADAATMAAQVDLEVFCSADSGLGQLTSLRGDDWAVSAVPLSGSTTPEAQAEIDSVLSTIATSIGGEIVATPCG